MLQQLICQPIVLDATETEYFRIFQKARLSSECISLRFVHLGSLSHRKDSRFVDFDSWSSLRLSLVSELHQDYPNYDFLKKQLISFDSFSEKSRQLR